MFCRHHSERPEAVQEPSGAAAVLFLCQEVQGGSEEGAGPAGRLRHHQARAEAHARPQQSQ